MANTFSWNFEALDVKLGPDAHDLTDVVYTVHWRYTATDGEDPPHTAVAIGRVNVTWEEGDPWIPYEDLVESDVVGWVESSLGDEQIEALQASFDAQIAEEITPTKEQMRGDELPWNEGD